VAYAERATGIIRRFAACFTDHLNPDLIEHTVEELIAQRVYGFRLCYKDINDHDALPHDHLLAVMVGKLDPTAQDRVRERDQGNPLMAELNRLELAPARASAESRYKKINTDRRHIKDLPVECFLDSRPTPPDSIVLELDATDDPLHDEHAFERAASVVLLHRVRLDDGAAAHRARGP
jgi:hypothetical protein